MKKLLKRVLGIGLADLVKHDPPRDQNLGNGLVVLRKKLLVDHHQPCLPDRRTGLLYGKSGRPAIDAESLSARSDGS